MPSQRRGSRNGTSDSPESFNPILGSHFVARITSREFAVLRIGKDTWTRHEVATVLGITHTTACMRLSNVCRRLGVTSTRDLYDKTDRYTFIGHGDKVGTTMFYAMFRAFENKGLDPYHWYHRSEDAKDLVTIATLKIRDRDAQAKKREKKRGRRSHVHDMRVSA